ncbi:MAG: flippase-like domain-containing protein [Candidatus Kapabacteria bacterium]|nr:flippase-like domain-containing protein [Candidatus Kapabacteria bacterium]
MKRAARILVTYIVPLILVVLTGSYLINGTSAADLDLMMNSIGRLNYGWVIVALLTGIVAHVARALRWEILLRPSGAKVSLSSSFNAVMIGYAANAIVPRAGELARPLVLAQRARIPAETSIGSVVVERVIDVLTLLAGIFIVMTYAQNELVTTLLRMQGAAPTTFAAADTQSTITSLFLILALLAAVVVIVVFTRAGEAIIGATLGKVHQKSASSIQGALHRLRDGLSSVRQPRLLIPITLFTLAIWALYIITTWSALMAMPYAATVSAGLADATLLLMILALAVTIAPTPGAIGVYHVAAQISLVSLFGATPAEGFVFAMISWIVNQGTALLIGGFCWIIETRSGIRIRLFSEPTSMENHQS